MSFILEERNGMFFLHKRILSIISIPFENENNMYRFFKIGLLIKPVKSFYFPKGFYEKITHDFIKHILVKDWSGMA